MAPSSIAAAMRACRCHHNFLVCLRRIFPKRPECQTLQVKAKRLWVYTAELGWSPPPFPLSCDHLDRPLCAWPLSDALLVGKLGHSKDVSTGLWTRSRGYLLATDGTEPLLQCNVRPWLLRALLKSAWCRSTVTPLKIKFCMTVPLGLPFTATELLGFRLLHLWSPGALRSRPALLGRVRLHVPTATGGKSRTARTKLGALWSPI